MLTLANQTADNDSDPHDDLFEHHRHDERYWPENNLNNICITPLWLSILPFQTLTASLFDSLDNLLLVPPWSTFNSNTANICHPKYTQYCQLDVSMAGWSAEVYCHHFLYSSHIIVNFSILVGVLFISLCKLLELLFGCLGTVFAAEVISALSLDQPILLVFIDGLLLDCWTLILPK